MLLSQDPFLITPFGITAQVGFAFERARAGSGGPAERLSEELTIWREQGHGDVVLAFAFSPDGKAVATVTEDRTLRVFRVTDIAGKGMPFMKLGTTKNLGGVAFGKSNADLAVLFRGAVQPSSLRPSHLLLHSVGHMRPCCLSISFGALPLNFGNELCMPALQDALPYTTLSRDSAEELYF